MKVIVVGAGEVGFHIADHLAREGHDVAIIEPLSSRERFLREKLNALVVRGSGASPEVLERAGVADTDLFIAVTNLDEVNVIACILANEYGVAKRIARVKSFEYGRQDGRFDATKLGINLLINPQAVVAEEIQTVIAHESATGVVELAGGRVLFLGYHLPDNSPLAGVSLAELGAIRGVYRLVVTAVTRGDRTVIPRGDDLLQAGDIVYFACRDTELPAVRYLFGLTEEDKARRIFILGGGRVGRLLARGLTDSGCRVTVVDHNEEHCEEFARDLEGVSVLNTEGTDVDTLRSEGLDEADVFVAVTQDDKSNILCSLLAKRVGAARAVALVNEPELLKLAPSLGVDTCLSPRLATASAILKHVRGGAVEALAVLESGRAEVLELVVPEGLPHLNKPLKTVRVPSDSIVASIARGEDVVIPTGEDHLEAGDHVVVFALPEAISRVQRFFGAT